MPCSTAASRSPRRACTTPKAGVGVGDAHGGVGGAVRAGVRLDGFEGVFFGAVVVFEPGVGGGAVEDPLDVVEHEVVIRVGGEREFGEDAGSAGEGLVGVATVADAGQAAGLLQGRLDHGQHVRPSIGRDAAGADEPDGLLDHPGRRG